MSEIVGALGFVKDEFVAETKTGRKAEIRRIQAKRVWRTYFGKKTLIESGEFEFVYRWIEPAEGRTRSSKDNWVIDGKSFLKRFRKLAPEEHLGRLE